MSAAQLHGWPLFLILTLVGDVLCLALATFGALTGRHRMPHLFWWILWLAQIPLGVQILVGLFLFARIGGPRSPFHLMYGALIVLTLVALHGLRPGGWLRRMLVKDDTGRWEARWLALLCLFLAGLVGRAYVTGLFGR